MARINRISAKLAAQERKKAFVGRTRLIREFTSALKARRDHLFSAEQPKVLNYYGLGGIGKSRLTAHLRGLAIDRCEDYAVSCIDFRDETVRDSARGLKALRENFESRPDIRFRHFDLAYSIYFARRNPDQLENKRDGSGILNKVGAAAGIMSLIPHFAFLSTFRDFGTAVQKLVEQAQIRGQYGDILRSFTSAPLEEIEEWLLEFFALDLAQAHADNLARSNYTICPVLVLDTFEALWESERTEANRFHPDRWVRDLIEATPFALWVISGRDKLRWTELSSEWRNIVQPFELSKLNGLQTTELLKAHGITDSGVIKAIRDVTHGHPYYVEICVDICIQLSAERAPVPADFAHPGRELFDRFIRYLADDEVYLLKVIAIAGSADEAQIRHLAGLLGFTVRPDVAEWLAQFSFVKIRSSRFYLHDTMMASLLEHAAALLKSKVEAALVEYLETNLSRADDLTIEDVICDQISHLLKLLARKPGAAARWLQGDGKRVFSLLQRRGSADRLISFLDPKREPVRSSMNDELFRVWIDAVHLTGAYERAADESANKLAGFSVQKIHKSPALAWFEVRRLHHLMMFTPVEPLLARCIEMLDWPSALADLSLLNELHFMIGGNLGLLRGDLRQARHHLDLSLSLGEERKSDAIQCRTLRKLADLIRYEDSAVAAEALIERAVAISDAKGLTRYSLYLRCQRADVHRIAGDFARSQEHFLMAERQAIKSGIRGWIAHARLGKAYSFLDEGDLGLARESAMEALAIHGGNGQAWGILQAELLLAEVDRLEGAQGLARHLTSAQAQAGKYGYLMEQRMTTISQNGDWQLARHPLFFI